MESDYYSTTVDDNEPYHHQQPQQRTTTLQQQQQQQHLAALEQQQRLLQQHPPPPSPNQQAAYFTAVDTGTNAVTSLVPYANPLHPQSSSQHTAVDLYTDYHQRYQPQPFDALAAATAATSQLVANGTLVDGQIVLSPKHHYPTAAIAAALQQRLTRNFSSVGSVSDGNSRQLNKSSMLEIAIDFTKPDAQRTRPLVAEGRRLYVCDHYMSVWSPVLRASIIECPGRELILPSVKYNSLLETLLCISPIHKRITEENINELLPIASEYQMEGLLHRCECYLMETRLSLLERLWVADRYRLQRLLIQCLRELRPHSKLDLSGPKYYSLSDRVKVQLLERLQGAQAPEEMPEPPLDADQFQRPNDLFFACIRAKNGKAFYANPYYLAAWSNTVAERLTSTNTAEFSCGATSDELMMLLMTTHPPQLRITEHNIGPILMAGCKLESGGVMRRCADFILSPHTQLTTFARLSLLDRCFLHELLDVCLKGGVHKPEQALDMACQPTYDCLSTKARAAILDRLANLLKKPGLLPHSCFRCKHSAPCHQVNWVCPKCGGYCAPGGGSGSTAEPKEPPAH